MRKIYDIFLRFSFAPRGHSFFQEIIFYQLNMNTLLVAITEMSVLADGTVTGAIRVIRPIRLKNVLDTP